MACHANAEQERRCTSHVFTRLSASCAVEEMFLACSAALGALGPYWSPPRTFLHLPLAPTSPEHHLQITRAPAFSPPTNAFH